LVFFLDLEEGFDGLDRLPLYLALVALDQRLFSSPVSLAS